MKTKKARMELKVNKKQQGRKKEKWGRKKGSEGSKR